MRWRQTATLRRGSPTDAKGRMRPRRRARQQRSEGDNSVDNQLALGYGELEPGPTSKAAPKNGAVQRENRQPTQDQMYLSRMLSADPDELSLTPAAMQKLNNRYGVSTVVAVMRAVHGFPPPIRPRSMYAYIRQICEGQV